jgi:hypothetical protein
MRSIFVLLILVMIGLNGKGQSVTALPDSVLSQCCLEVTLLNGNVTTVDWVFVQYITRDGTGTKLFVEYAPNFGGIQWETQIRIQDDFDDVLERSKFIVIPFTVGSTDYGINRNWIANIEENTTTGGTWIYGRFGTPTKRKFSAVEDYEYLKNLLLLCRPRAIIVAENGLYTEGDTVRMGGFLIENTSITTEGYNWQMKDTLSSAEFGFDYDSPINGDTAAYFARRWGPWRQIMEMGQKRWMSEVRDTTGGDWSQVSHGFTNGSPIPYFIVESSNNAGTQYSQLILQKNFASWTMIDPFNSNYTMGFQMNSSTISIGANDANGPGNGPSMGTYAFGSTHYLYLKTDDVDNGTASVGQFLQLKNLGTGEVDFATIDLSAYLPIADTAAMLDPYIQGAGTINNLAKFTAGRVVGNAAITENGSRVVMGLPQQFKSYSTVGMPSLSDLDIVENSTTGFLTRYKTGVSENIITSTGASSGQIPVFSSAGKLAGISRFTYNFGTGVIKITGTSVDALEITSIASGFTNNKIIVNQYAALGFQMHNQPNNAAMAIYLPGDIYGRFALGLDSGVPFFGMGPGPTSRDVWFRRIATNTLTLGFTTSATEKFRFTDSALGILTNSPQRTLHVAGEMRLTDLITDTPTRIIGADADGDLGQITFGTGVSAPSGVLNVSTWKTELEAGNNYTIGATSKTTTIKGAGNVFRMTNATGASGLKLANEAIIVAKVAPGRFGGNYYIQDTTGVVDNLFYMGQDDDATIQALGSGPQITHTLANSKLSGGFSWAYAVRVDTSVTIPALRIVYGNRYASTTSPGSHRWYAGLQATATIPAYQFDSDASSGKLAFVVNNTFYIRQNGKVYFGSDSTMIFDPALDVPQFNKMGAGNKEAADLSKTQSAYIAGFATDGTLLDLEQKRDTTIYVDDADYDFSAALTTAQISARYNRVIFLMTTTAAAGSDSELTLHTPDINLMQCEYLVRSTDEAGGFSNVIRFGTNNAVDSTNGLASSYFPAAGQGVGVRAGLRSGVYKYFYY